MVFKFFKRKKNEKKPEDAAGREPSDASAEAGFSESGEEAAIEQEKEAATQSRVKDSPEAKTDKPGKKEKQEADAHLNPDPEDTGRTQKDAAPADAEPPAKTPGGFFGRLRQGLSKTREILTTDVDELFLGKKKIDDELLEDLEALLITSDMGMETTMALMEGIHKKARKLSDAGELKAALKEEILALMEKMPPVPAPVAAKPFVIMVVGVNGVGKTTTIGKIAARLKAEGKQPLIAAADTFRAAAVEQLAIWAERSGSDFIRGRDKADPAAVAFDAIEASVARGIDVALIDTAGRLHTNVNLMEELKKIKRAIGKKIPDAPHQVLLVLDATTGQNAISQANLFKEAIGVDSIALTKLDGTAKGGVVISICNNLELPLQFVGIGEKIDDLQLFDKKRFVDAIF